tara:strand:+ start:5519 stop:7993 length:2475 start_codon:yes stop_codon:yes gene_type:complete
MALPPQPFGTMVARNTDVDPMDVDTSVDVSVDMPEDFAGGAQVTETPDGALVEAMLDMEELPIDELIPFDANLAEFLEDDVLREIASDLVGAYEDDLSSRSDWEETYVKGLDLLGVKTEERSSPFEGASSVTHPLISESVTQFQAQAYKELLPSGGPVKTQVVGVDNAETQAQANRVKDYLNYLILDKMDEYDPDTDQMLFYLPLAGMTFKKIYYDAVKQRPVAKFVPAQDVVVPYSATDLRSAARITHVLKMSDNEIRKLQVSGFYRDVELSEGTDQEENEVRSKVDDLQGTSRSSYTDDVRTILEMHVELDLDGFEDVGLDDEPTGIKLPYIVTLDRDSDTVLAVRRNYVEGDATRESIPYFVPYKFLPGLGFYGFGLTHMIGGLGRAATSILRQLIDAGTLSNLPAGFKARGMRVSNSDEPLQPGEFRDIDAPGGNIRDAIIPLPYKEPSATLAQLLGALVEGGRRFVSVADNQAQNMGQEQPVGTTVALLERGMKVLSAIHKRLHHGQKQEFKILARIVSENLPETYPYQLENDGQQLKQQDFDGRVDIIPVSDPNIFSMAQRVALAQEQLKLAQTNPQMHNLHAAYRRMYQALEVQNIDEILPPPPKPQPMDPAMENGRAAAGTPMQAFPDQNHEAHIQAHVAFIKLPLIQGTPHAVLGLLAHIMEHVALLARQQMEEQSQQLIQQVQVAVQTGAIDAQQAQQQIAQTQAALQDPKHSADYAALLQQQILENMLPEIMPPAPDPMADPLVQIRNAELEIKRQELVQDGQLDQAKLAQKAASEAARLELQEDVADERNDVNRERIAAQMAMAAQRNQGGR